MTEAVNMNTTDGAAHPDAALLDLCASFIALQAQLVAWNEGTIASWDEGEAINVEWWATLRKISATPSVTLDGLRAKALVAPIASRAIDLDQNVHDHLTHSICAEMATLFPPTDAQPPSSAVA